MVVGMKPGANGPKDWESSLPPGKIALKRGQQHRTTTLPQSLERRAEPNAGVGFAQSFASISEKSTYS